MSAVVKQTKPTYEFLSGFTAPEVRTRYTARDIILHALAIGAGSILPDRRALEFVYEKRLTPLPSYHCILGWSDPHWLRTLGISLSHLVHQSEKVEIFQPLTTEGSVIVRSRIAQVVDRGVEKGLLIEAVADVFDVESGGQLSRTTSNLLCLADGGLEGAPKQVPAMGKASTERSEPDAVITVHTSVEQAALYRLCGDLNPIHIDPDAAAVLGFDRPILHGLCTLGIALHSIKREMAELAEFDVVSFGCRFTAPVFPGDVLSVELWQDGGDIAFQVRVGDRIAIKDGHVAMRVGVSR